MIIKLLPEDTIRKISTGELINNISDVIKELLENSLDANSLNIKIEVLNNGLDLIKITDDGFGIKKKDLFLSIKRHSTSKIFFYNDLLKLNSFGFRGESLSCISSISDFSISSKFKESNSNYGWLLFNNKRKWFSYNIKPISHNYGTTVIVKNIFLNNINKRKELYILNKNEWFFIKKIIISFVLSNYKINFFIYKDNLLYKNYIKKFKDTKSSILDRIISVYGEKIVKNYQYLFIKDKYISLKGYLFVNNKFKNIRFVFLNSRIISSKNLLYSILNNFFFSFYGKNILFSYILFLKIKSKYININLCPDKSKISFINSSLIFSTLYRKLFIFFKKKKMVKNRCIFLGKKSCKNISFLDDYLNYFLVNFGNIVNILNQRFICSILSNKGLLIISDLLFIFYYMNILIFKKKYFFLIKIKKINKLKIFLSRKYFLNRKKIFFILNSLGINISYKNNCFLITSIPVEFINLNLKKFFLSFLFFLKKVETNKFLLELTIYWLSNYMIINNVWNQLNSIKLICKFHNYYLNFKYKFKKKIFYFLNFSNLFLYSSDNIWL